MDETAAVEASREGDKAAFGFLVDKHYKNIYRYAYHSTEAIRTPMTYARKLFESFRPYRAVEERRQFQQWLFTIAANISRKRIKKMKIQRNFVSLSSDSPNQSPEITIFSRLKT